jgi:hypothetical protein
MPNLYRNESSYPKNNAQANLCGRTHYVDDGTLKFHHSRVLSSHVVDHGLLFAIVTSDALDMDNTKRGYRYVIFDIFGNVVGRTLLEDAYSTSRAATKAMWTMLNNIDAKAHTLNATEGWLRACESEAVQVHSIVNALAKKAA